MILILPPKIPIKTKLYLDKLLKRVNKNILIKFRKDIKESLKNGINPRDSLYRNIDEISRYYIKNVKSQLEQLPYEYTELIFKAFDKIIDKAKSSKTSFLYDITKYKTKEQSFNVTYNEIIDIPNKLSNIITNKLIKSFDKFEKKNNYLTNDNYYLFLTSLEMVLKQTQRRTELLVVNTLKYSLATTTIDIYKNVGIEQYVWIAMMNEHTVGCPWGLYPIGNEQHGDHWIRHQKVFDIDKPPHDGHAGIPPNCYCIASGIIK